MFSRSAISPGPVGFQPSFSRVCALEAHRSIAANDGSQPKCSFASSAVLLTTGTFRPRPMAVAMSFNGTPLSQGGHHSGQSHRNGQAQSHNSSSLDAGLKLRARAEVRALPGDDRPLIESHLLSDVSGRDLPGHADQLRCHGARQDVFVRTLQAQLFFLQGGVCLIDSQREVYQGPPQAVHDFRSQ